MFDTNVSPHCRLTLERDRTLGALEDFVPEVLLTMLGVATEVGTLLVANFALDWPTVGLLHVTAKVGLNAETLLADGALVDEVLKRWKKSTLDVHKVENNLEPTQLPQLDRRVFGTELTPNS